MVLGRWRCRLPMATLHCGHTCAVICDEPAGHEDDRALLAHARGQRGHRTAVPDRDTGAVRASDVRDYRDHVDTPFWALVVAVDGLVRTVGQLR